MKGSDWPRDMLQNANFNTFRVDGIRYGEKKNASAPQAGFEIKFKYVEKYFLENKMHYDHCLFVLLMPGWRELCYDEFFSAAEQITRTPHRPPRGQLVCEVLHEPGARFVVSPQYMPLYRGVCSKSCCYDGCNSACA